MVVAITNPNTIQETSSQWARKSPMPMGTFSGLGLSSENKTSQGFVQSDTFTKNTGIKTIRKPAKNNPNIVTTQQTNVEEQEETQKKNNKRAQIISSVILLVGGIALGYGHRNLITKGFDAMKQNFGKWTANPTCQKVIQGGKKLIEKAKDIIFVKPQ